MLWPYISSLRNHQECWSNNNIYPKESKTSLDLVKKNISTMHLTIEQTKAINIFFCVEWLFWKILTRKQQKSGDPETIDAPKMVDSYKLEYISNT